MRSTRGAFWALAVLGGYFIWRNRFGIQRQLHALGIKTPGNMDRGATLAEHSIKQNI